MLFLPLLFFCCSLSSFISPSIAADTITANQTLLDNGETLISASQTFELGFFSPWNSSNRYVGIWFKNVPQQTVVWVANKNNPLTDSSGVLTINSFGNILILNNRTNTILWSSNSTSTTTLTNPIMQLLDSGNLVVNRSDDNSGNYLWQSFDYPCDTLIPGMKLGWDLATNQEWYLTSWTSVQDPTPGPYTYRVDRNGLPQIVLRQGSTIIYRSGSWDGARFGGGLVLGANTIFKPIFVFDSNNDYYSFENIDNSVVSRYVVNESNVIQHLYWSQARNVWIEVFRLQVDTCDNYDQCGPNGICDINGHPICMCPNGFTPKFPSEWETFIWTSGCVPKIPLNNCSVPEGFRRFSGLKLPDKSVFLGNKTAANMVECSETCSRNCSCVAYATTELNWCVLWYGDMFDIREYSEGGQDLYIRLDASQLGSSNKAKRRAIIASVTVISGVLLVLISMYLYRKRAAKRREVLTAQRRDNPTQDNNQINEEDDLELPLFDLATISSATNNFSFSNKIGEGGFGPVYKGVLPTGQEIAVKRLSKDSRQGLKEFKNEVILYLKLQHRNLVRLVGCCIHGEERMLIYEYLPNKSLDLFIFNQTKGTSLNWGMRFDVIVGIARGLLYLHRDSRLRIIHRDLKASNILLDSEMNPKISDFGLARTFGGDQSQENTNRVIGTYGYMSPEYAIDGLFSVKSDVFSFGVIVLEIVSGKKNRGFYHSDHDLNLLGHAWKLWTEGNPMNLVDASMESPVPTSEVLRCIQVGLLCVQQRPEDRPQMSSVLLMLDSENPLLPQPKQPGFYTERFPVDTDSSSTGKQPFTTSNEVTVTLLQGR